MRILLIALVLVTMLSAAGAAANFADCTGVVRAFADSSSWMSSCFVVGDGSWVVTTARSVTEVIGPNVSQTVRYPLFISPYTGLAYQCEVKAVNKEMDVALLKLPVSGLPAAPLAQISEFAKAATGTTGQLSSGELAGNKWPTSVYGLIVEKSSKGSKLVVNQWGADKVFVTDMGKYRWAFISVVSPDTAIPNGSIVARETAVVGMYINRLRVTGGQDNVVYGRCAMSPEMARFLGDSGVSTATLYDPPKPTVQKAPNADAAFQLQVRIYSFMGQQMTAKALEPAAALVKLRPKDAQSHLALGQAQLASEKFEEALKSFEAAAALDPNLPALRTNRAIAMAALKKSTEAEKELLKAAEESPNDPRPIVALAEFYLANEKTADKAAIYAKQAATMSPNSAAAQLLLGKAYKSSGNMVAAITAIGEAIKLSPDLSEAYYALGATYEAGGDTVHAEQAYRKLVEKLPKL
jgi:Flp pilus assembly protein TadD